MELLSDAEAEELIEKTKRAFAAELRDRFCPECNHCIGQYSLEQLEVNDQLFCTHCQKSVMIDISTDKRRRDDIDFCKIQVSA